MEKQYRNLIVSIENGICWLTINRPEVRNALDAKTLQEIEELFAELEDREDVRVIIIEGAGNKVFVSGADIQQLYERETLEALRPGIQKVFNQIEHSNKVTIAAVKGYALGGGCELTLACDIRVASENAKFGLPELNLGIIPGGGGTQRLSRIIGQARALDMILTGEIIDAVTAEKYGLVKKVIKEENWKEELVSLAEQIMKKGPVATRLAKIAVNYGLNLDMQSSLMLEKLAQTVAFSTEDRKEGTKAFLEKRKANFKNK